jgi:uncharacterized tellurite resistance protein B-like protein
MRLKGLFTTDQWQTLQYAVMWVFQEVAGADGNVDRKEQAALKNVTSNAAKFKDPLAKELLLSIDVNAGVIFRQSMTDMRGKDHGLKDVAKIIDSKFSKDEAILFKKTLIGIGYYIANISGEESAEMSEEEATSLAKVAFNLNLTVEDLMAAPTVEDISKNL